MIGFYLTGNFYSWSWVVPIFLFSPYNFSWFLVLWELSLMWKTIRWNMYLIWIWLTCNDIIPVLQFLFQSYVLSFIQMSDNSFKLCWLSLEIDMIQGTKKGSYTWYLFLYFLYYNREMMYTQLRCHKYYHNWREMNLLEQISCLLVDYCFVSFLFILNVWFFIHVLVLDNSEVSWKANGTTCFVYLSNVFNCTKFEYTRDFVSSYTILILHTVFWSFVVECPILTRLCQFSLICVCIYLATNFVWWLNFYYFICSKESLLCVCNRKISSSLVLKLTYDRIWLGVWIQMFNFKSPKSDLFSCKHLVSSFSAKQ